MDKPLPHQGVYARLGISPIHGIGVFALRPIPAGTDVFGNDQVEMVWVERSELGALLPAEKALYHDFGIHRGTRIGCPVNFHNLTPGWYCNEPDAGEEPNLAVEEDFTFRASRNIAEGEELTVRYSEFSRQP
jgi:SET domain-containing protein